MWLSRYMGYMDQTLTSLEDFFNTSIGFLMVIYP